MLVEHLGDGAYVTLNKDFVGQIILTANHHDPHFASDIIHLDSAAVKLLVKLIEQDTPPNATS